MTNAEAMKLLKQHRLTVRWDGGDFGEWTVRGWYQGRRTGMPISEEVRHDDLNAAIADCIAKMRRASTTVSSK